MSADSPAPPTAPAAPSPAAVVRILHVDDDEANRYAVSRTLRHAGYQVEEAATGEDALVMAERGPFDLILLDVQLPGMDGFEAARRLRAAPATRHTPVVHLSAHATTPADRATGLEGGAAAYLTRPIESRELLATIAAMVGVHRAEQHARRSAREWQSTFDAIPDAIYLLDQRNRIVRTNAAMRRACGSFGRALVGSEHHVALRALLGTDPPAMAGSFDARCEVEVSANGRAYRWTLDPVRDENGVTTGAVGIVSDVTERRDLAAAVQKRNDELQLADKRKDEFLAMLAHEIRNPLGAIAGASALLDGASNAPGATPDVVRGTIRRQLRHLTRLVDDLLDVSRITRGKIELRRSSFDVVAVAEQAVTAVRPAMENGGHELTFERPADGERVEVEGDSVRVEQVISNLLDNAAKYTDRGGHVTLSVSAVGDEAVIRVRDDGIGIAPERIEHVFDLFVQVDPTIDRARGGLGIGLTLVRQIVAMHGGTVTATSEGVGKGSQFEVRLPRAASREVRESAPADRTPAQGIPAETSTSLPPAATPDPGAKTPQTEKPVTASPTRVLIVEDNDDNRLMLRFVVEMKGYEVIEAADGLEGVEKALAEKPALVLVDVGLPGIDGFEVARRIRKVDTERAMRLIALTGYGSEQDRRESREAGFDDHLLKPVDQDRLFAALERK